MCGLFAGFRYSLPQSATEPLTDIAITDALLSLRPISARPDSLFRILGCRDAFDGLAGLAPYSL